jgi:hypothetical protein
MGEPRPPTRLEEIRHFFTQGGCIQTDDAWWMLGELERLTRENAALRVARDVAPGLSQPQTKELQRLSEPS